MKNSKLVLTQYESSRKLCGFCQLGVKDKLGKVHFSQKLCKQSTQHTIVWILIL